MCLKTLVRILALPPTVLSDPEKAPNFGSRCPLARSACTGSLPCLGHRLFETETGPPQSCTQTSIPAVLGLDPGGALLPL